MKCEICGRDINDGAKLHRQNEKGITGIWRCEKCNTLPVDPIVQEIFDLMDGKGLL